MPTRDIKEIDMIVVHCAATPDGKVFTTKQVDDWHKERGFLRDLHRAGPLKHIGYHTVIELDGSVHPGRELDEVPAAMTGYNRRGLAVCLIGTSRYTRPQWDALKRVVEDWQVFCRLHSKEPLILGHTVIANPPKRCPGFDVDAWLADGMLPLKGHIC